MLPAGHCVPSFFLSPNTILLMGATWRVIMPPVSQGDPDVECLWRGRSVRNACNGAAGGLDTGELDEMSRQLHDAPNSSIVKQCPCCGRVWRTRDEFLSDPQLELGGYQVDFGDLILGLFLFTHVTCESTMAMPAELFRDLYDGPVYAQRATGTADCPKYCLRESELAPCPAQCECAYVREILQIVRRWPKAPKRGL
jgi:hypothetical protein